MLDRAKEQWREKERQDAASAGSSSSMIAQLAAQLVRSCVVQPASPAPSRGTQRPTVTIDPVVLEQLTEGSILSEERGRDASFLRGALEEGGGSYVCSRCQGVVKVDRRQAHETVWCPALPQSDSDGDAMDVEGEDGEIDSGKLRQALLAASTGSGLSSTAGSTGGSTAHRN